jgi:predicted phosphodiesterase
MNILVLGDCHTAWHRLIDAVDRAVAEHGIAAAIQVGDFGFFRQQAEMLLRGWRGRFPVPLYVIDGNHEDHTWLKQEEAAGSFPRWAEEKNLRVQARGAVATLGGRTIGFCGGALHADRRQHGSIDKGTTNWLTNRQADAAAAAFNAAGVDVLVSHSCPHSIGIGMIGSAQLAPEVERYITSKGFDPGPITDCGEPGLTRLWSRLATRPRHWIFGHFHEHKECTISGTQFHCIGSIDGSDRRASPVGYIFETVTDTMTAVDIGHRS